jgi:phenylalanyl-tRNA synthetase alpha chain
LHEYEIKVLEALKRKNGASLEELEEQAKISRDSVLWALEGLASKGAVEVGKEKKASAVLSEEGKKDLSGFPEEILVKNLLEEGGKGSLSKYKDMIALNWAKRNGWVTIESGTAKLTDKGREFASGKSKYQARSVLEMINSASSDPDKIVELIAAHKDAVDSLVKRGLVDIKERLIISAISINNVGEGLLDSARGEDGIGALTKEIIVNKTWEKKGFKPYDINAPVEKSTPARMHPLHEFINSIRGAWLEMGFVEVSGPIIESAFWNFDTLFSPQDHPTREMQDTFFLSNPKQIDIEDIELLGQVRKMHLKGWGDVWKEEVAKQALLRTQTTAVSSHYMHMLSKEMEQDYPVKLFSVGKVFRNESVDYKHLAEFYQCDGIIVGNRLTLANLTDTLKKFYSKVGIDDVRIVPSYFPFTEPSLEVQLYDESRQKWLELAGGGIIRKEITKALGLGNKTVLAWGIGLERLLFRALSGLDSLMPLYTNDIGWLRTRKRLIL